MEQIIIKGGKKLRGIVKIEGAKNAVLPIMAASLLAEEGVTILNNVPVLSDVHTMIQVIESLNANVEFNEELNQLKIDATRPLYSEANYEYISRIRASIVVMGPLLARSGRAKVALPGGCTIGTRPIDLHLKGFQALGVTIQQNDNCHIEASARIMSGKTIYLEYPSVGATQNIIMAAIKAQGVTVIENVAKEPEIVDLANFLNKMGAKIVGAGTQRISIEGVLRLHAAEHTVIQDRIEAGTFMIAAAITQGNILIEDAVIEHNVALISTLTKTGVIIRKERHGLRVIGPKVIKPACIITSPYPGFPTDLQAQMTALFMIAGGSSIVLETVFENRFQHFIEMGRMNGVFKINGNMAIVSGSTSIRGADVSASDLRAAAALVLLGLHAEGVTRVSNLEYLDRGYSKFHEKLIQLGANLERLRL